MHSYMNQCGPLWQRLQHQFIRFVSVFMIAKTWSQFREAIANDYVASFETGGVDLLSKYLVRQPR